MRLDIDGVEIFVATGGRAFDPALPLVVFLHGAGLDHSVWALLARWFAHRGCGVLAPDLPGHGRSEGEPLESIGAMADFSAALIDASGARTIDASVAQAIDVSVDRNVSRREVGAFSARVASWRCPTPRDGERA